MSLIITSIKSIRKAKLQGIFVASALWTLLVLLVFIGVTIWISDKLINVNYGWLDTVITAAVGVLSGVGAWFMLPALSVLISGLYIEKVIHKIELAYYPEHVRKTEPRFWPDFKHDLRFTFKSIFLNLLILPTYLIGIGFVISIALNTYLLGREFFESAAGYHLGKPKAKAFGKENKTKMYKGGFLITLLTLIPVVNLFIPLFGIIYMTHLYHGIKKAI